MADRDDLAMLIAPETIALERSLGARAERGEQARAGADRILAAGWVKATADDTIERVARAIARDEARRDTGGGWGNEKREDTHG
jgi:hypothetical protein